MRQKTKSGRLLVNTVAKKKKLTLLLIVLVTLIYILYIRHKTPKIQRTTKYNYLFISQNTWQPHPKSKHPIDWPFKSKATSNHTLGQISCSVRIGLNSLTFSQKRTDSKLWVLTTKHQLKFRISFKRI